MDQSFGLKPWDKDVKGILQEPAYKLEVRVLCGVSADLFISQLALKTDVKTDVKW